MKVWTFGASLQRPAPNHLELLWSKAMVMSIKAKGATRLHQVMIRKTNYPESLLKCRKENMMMSKPGSE